MRESAEKIEAASESETLSEKETREFFENLPHADAVVVLGGELRKRIVRSKDKKTGEVINREKIEPGIESKMRALGALELLRHGVVKKIILTGGKMRFPRHGVKEMPDIAISEAMRDYIYIYCERYGIPEEAIVIEKESINTKQNLENAAKIMEDGGDKSFYLTTNEYHLGRGGKTLDPILEDHNLKLAELKTAETLLRNRSSHYKDLIDHYEFPESMKNAPKEAALKGIKEFLKRAWLYFDPKYERATFVADIVRRRN